MVYCPNCGASWPEEDRFCSNCGCPLQSQTSDTTPTKKGGWFMPVLLMVLMAVAGTIVYFAIRPLATQPASTEAPWFTMNGTTLVSFDPGAYSGSSDLMIPATIDGVQVLAIGDSCFSGCGTLTSVILPQSLTSIGDRAFSACSSLRGIYIPSSVVQIGEYAFRNCTALEAICLTQGTSIIGEGTFEQCDNLVYILYMGGIDQWRALYDGYICPFTYIYCQDGVYPQGSGN